MKQTTRFITREKDLMELLTARHHRNIITFYAAIPVGSPPSVMNFVLEYCCHGDLNSFFKGQNSRVSFEQCLQYMENITSGVRHLHELEVCHRDLTPPNILIQLDDSGEKYPKVADFGLQPYFNYKRFTTTYDNKYWNTRMASSRTYQQWFWKVFSPGGHFLPRAHVFSNAGTL